MTTFRHETGNAVCPLCREARDRAAITKRAAVVIDRQKLEVLLSRRFPGAGSTQIAAAANAIMGLDDDWEELGDDTVYGYRFGGNCVGICDIARAAQSGAEFRLLRRRQH